MLYAEPYALSVSHTERKRILRTYHRVASRIRALFKPLIIAEAPRKCIVLAPHLEI